MKNSTKLLILLGVISFIFLGCAKKDRDESSTSSTTTTSTSTSTYTRSNTPAKSTVPIPASLSGTGGASSRTANAEDYSSSAIFYTMIKSLVSMMKGIVSGQDLNLMLADVRISDGYKADSSTCYENQSYSITFTQGMYNALVAMEKEFGGTEGESGSMSASFKQSIGTTIKPPVAYKFEDISAGGYNHQISTGDSCSSLTESYRWNTAKTKLASQFKDTNGTDTFKGTITYDNTTKMSTFQMDMTGSVAMKMYFSYKTCTGMTGDCVIYEFKESYSDPTYGTTLMSAVGKADDAGGYAKATMSMTYNGTNMELQYKEFWQGNGTVTAISTCLASYGGSTTDCTVSSNWTTQGTENSTYDESGGYDSGTTTVAVSGVTADGSYLLIETGKTPSSNPEAVLGFGEIRSGKTEWEFWGPDTSITMDVYLINNDGTYTIQSGASVTLT
ncbi:MAG TPA: hypothetical protein EYO46_06945 [Candidatus Lambdaproteobacteria bacterium]|nr:hypothetical protein [Candidatus Lambdaproteobacteria bacterium]HIB45942.1 hypothetical protein [Candidatus Lambdaproteobacteria bacterium]HIB93371.1 hypothetical protein [Candidatus Lambdaproteobacteria bacterium]